MAKNLFLDECERQGIESLCLKAIKMCINDCPTREEVMGIYKFLIYLSSENEEVK